ncbi:FKBP-type peptidyl-prolyl cis-trans isomerase FkpA [Nitrosomonas marina]|uniref:Peptidyl-prolyl cis-trans isomerase n=1 Tax=Nitrosomonas marina TaxID=917 RepID=A0A1I0CBV0_9PROT|nr:FKBP-type peptidyl-prolyl cis-trans isomerase [Nitrosomonas marina]SET16602.1 FKBP-type peptidyl-prolyl cis-trans isomerase FkpA [Nitrosomonas marina]
MSVIKKSLFPVVCIVFLMMFLLSQTLFAYQEQTENPEPQFEKIDRKIGEGKEADVGDTVNVHYTGWLYDESAPDKKGRKFDSSHDRKAHFSFMLGAGRVIKGWDQGVRGMTVGGERTLIIPSSMAYGKRGAGGVIPPNATLIFDVELVGIQAESPY